MGVTCTLNLHCRKSQNQVTRMEHTRYRTTVESVQLTTVLHHTAPRPPSISSGLQMMTVLHPWRGSRWTHESPPTLPHAKEEGQSCRRCIPDVQLCRWPCDANLLHHCWSWRPGGRQSMMMGGRRNGSSDEPFRLHPLSVNVTHQGLEGLWTQTL